VGSGLCRRAKISRYKYELYYQPHNFLLLSLIETLSLHHHHRQERLVSLFFVLYSWSHSCMAGDDLLENRIGSAFPGPYSQREKRVGVKLDVGDESQPRSFSF